VPHTQTTWVVFLVAHKGGFIAKTKNKGVNVFTLIENSLVPIKEKLCEQL